MGGFFRKSTTVSDARPPAPPSALRASLGTCVRCGLPVLAGEELGTGVSPTLSHFVCDAQLRGAVERRVEAMRALHRAIAALSNLPDVRESLEDEVTRLPDALDVDDAVRTLERARTLVECTATDRPEQRRLALSYLDSMLRRLAA